MQLISVDRDKCFKIWDLRGGKVFQTFKDTRHYYPEDCLSAMTFDPYRRCIVAASTYVRIWPIITDTVTQKERQQAARVVPGLYNTKYHHVLSFDGDTVNVWQVQTGRKIFSFTALTEDGMEEVHRDTSAVICAAHFDTQCRKIIVVFTTGDIACFNYMNGEVVRRLQRATKVC